MTKTTDTHGRQAGRPRDIPRRGWKDITKRVIAEVKQDNLPVIAAGCAFYAWIALFPALIALITIYGLVANPETISQQLGQLTSVLSQDTARVITQPITTAINTGSSGLTLGLVASLAAVLWSASGGMDGLIKGIDIAYDEPARSFPKRRGLALLLTLGGIVFVIVAVALVAVAPVVLGNIRLGLLGRIIAQLVRWTLLTLLVMVGLAVMYRVAPHRDNPRFRWVSWGAAVAAVLWLLGSAAFSFYVNNFGSYNKTYGALAGVIVLNLWLFLSTFIVLLGAEINAEMEAQTRKDTTIGQPQPMGQRGAAKADELGEASGS
jgi:membrane protein